MKEEKFSFLSVKNQIRIKFFLVKFRNVIGHFLHYWIFPMMVGQKPFWGRSSHILWEGISGMRDADYMAVFSERDRKVYMDAGIKSYWEK